jgi:hypothetical protein
MGALRVWIWPVTSQTKSNSKTAEKSVRPTRATSGAGFAERRTYMDGSNHSALRAGSPRRMAAMRVPWWLKIAWTVWLIAWAPIYWSHYGLQNFLFFCDIGNILIGIGLWLESPLIFSWQACSLLVFQTLYTIDLAGAVLGSHHVIGGTEYMFSPDLPLFMRLLSLFHVVTPPLLVWAIWRLGYDPRGWKWQAVTCWIVVPVNYFWRPEYDVNWARGLFFRTQHAVPAAVYLLAYLAVVPLVIYFPTHLLLLRLSQRWARQG